MEVSMNIFNYKMSRSIDLIKRIFLQNDNISVWFYNCLHSGRVVCRNKISPIPAARIRIPLFVNN